MSMVKNEKFKITKGEKMLKLYQFHSKVAKHFFCSVCGIYTHHWRRSKPCFAYNIACIEEVDKDRITEFTQVDGRNFSVT